MPSYTDAASHAAALRAVESLRATLASLLQIEQHARLDGNHDRADWAAESIVRIRADIERLERDLGVRP